ncbi:MAG TPA: hypothetical protein DDW98_09105 [Gammaproteobacteria bacterium]|jgi:hypothetical protein|nr:hypothetical protein [Gammaproteobacteria bacterium]
MTDSIPTPPLAVPKTSAEYDALVKEWDAAMYFFNASDDPDEVRRAGARVGECERIMDQCSFDNEGNFVPPNDPPHVSERHERAP